MMVMPLSPVEVALSKVLAVMLIVLVAFVGSLLVVVQAGATETAYFTVSWTIVSAILVAVLMVCGPFIAETAAHPEQLATLLGRFLRLFGLVIVAASAALAS